MENCSVALYAPFWEASLIREVESCTKKLKLAQLTKPSYMIMRRGSSAPILQITSIFFSPVLSMLTDLFPQHFFQVGKKWAMCFDISVISLTKQSPSCTGLQQVLNNEQTIPTDFTGTQKRTLLMSVQVQGTASFAERLTVHLRKTLSADLLSTSLYHLWAAFVRLPGCIASCHSWNLFLVYVLFKSKHIQGQLLLFKWNKTTIL